MGEVFRAHDTSLGRAAAVKVLPDDLIASPDRRARLEREARVLAQLNHPQIAAVYGIETDGAVPYLAMEFVPGTTLARDIARGPLAVPEVIRVFQQLADALTAAHERGIVHRDLKPANIMRSADGCIKVLDFGLAKAFEAEGGSTAAATVTGVATRAGIVLGTAAYMSPEQALGRAVDPRTDIWALGCVLYECLTGRRAFDGASSAETIAGVLRGEVDLRALPPDTPPALRATIERCLCKDPADRWRSARDLWLAFSDASTTRHAGSPASGSSLARPRRIAIAAALLAAGVGAGVLLAMLARPRTSDTDGPRTALEVRLPANHSLNMALGPAIALSPDGRTLVYAASDGTSSSLYRRDLVSFVSLAIPGTEAGRHPVFSPDGRSIAFFAAGRLVQMRLSGQRVDGCGISPTAKGDCLAGRRPSSLQPGDARRAGEDQDGGVRTREGDDRCRHGHGRPPVARGAARRSVGAVHGPAAGWRRPANHGGGSANAAVEGRDRRIVSAFRSAAVSVLRARRARIGIGVALCRGLRSPDAFTVG
jgi:hypothetical protein